MKLSKQYLYSLALLLTLPAAPQQTRSHIAASASTAVPPLIPYSGVVSTVSGAQPAATASISFLIYKDEQGGEPLFAETQALPLDATGHYKAQLGATLTNGIPIDLFVSGEARWLEVQVAGEPPQPRVLLVSVPYALKAADAATLGGLPPSAFALARSASEAVGAVSPAIIPNVTSNVTTTGGTLGFVPKFSGTSSVVDSPIFVGSTGAVGIGTTTPTATLTVDGAMTITGTSVLNGQVLVPPQGTATASEAFNSQFIKLSSSAFNSSSHSVVSPRFQLQVEPTGNDSASPNGTLNLLASATASAPVETGFFINTNGTIHFAPGQTFPGTGSGTITGVTAGTALTGGGTSGHVTLNVDTTKVPLLTSANTFAASQALSTGDLSLASTFSANTGVINIGGIPFLHGFSKGNKNVFVGGAGNFTTTGTATAATGFGALAAQTTGSLNTASGSGALLADTKGSDNTAAGADALASVTTGSSNTGVGVFAGPTGGTVSNTTAVGANAKVGQSNSLVLGNTTSTPGAKFVNVGIGTATPASILEAAVSVSSALGPALTLTNPGGAGGSPTNAGTAESIDFNSYLPAAESEGSLPEARIEAVDDGFFSDNLIFFTKFVSGASSFLQQDLTIQANGQTAVGLPTSGTLPALTALLTVFNTGPTGWDGIDTFGGAEVGSGISATGGDETASSSIQGGTGGSFTGGFSPGTTGDGIFATPGDATFSTGAGWAGLFIGDIDVTGTVFGGVKDFKIDHPLDPANKYLVHASVESSEMMNIYTGNVTTDELGIATVNLPDWFEAENADFRYQLTVIGGRFAQAIVSKEIADHQFTISTNASNVKVSWQVTAVRQDAYAKAHPLVVEQQKPAHERGFYQNPELFGQPAEKQTEWGRHPQQMQHMKLQQEAHKAALAKSKSNGGGWRHDQPASAVSRSFATSAPVVP